MSLPASRHSHSLARLAAQEAARGSFEAAHAAITSRCGPVIGRRQIGQAVVNAAGDIGTFYAARIPEPCNRSGSASWEGMARNLYGLFWFFVFLAIVNSTIGNADAGVNIVSRMSYAMGRTHAFPSALARVHPRHRCPMLAIVISFITTAAITLGLGLAYNPVNAFAMTGTGR